jgi:transposase
MLARVAVALPARRPKPRLKRMRPMSARTFVGLDVHARSIWAGVLDGLTGEVRSQSVPTGTIELLEWIASLPGPLTVAYEAGPTGFALARAFSAAGIGCLWRLPAASSGRPPTAPRPIGGMRFRLARLLRLDELVAVRMSSRAGEAARDLARARHPISKLLLRHGLLREGRAWMLAHQRWLAQQRFAERPLQLAYEEALAGMYAVCARRDALDAAIRTEAASEPWAGIVSRLCCPRGIGTPTAFGLAVEIGERDCFPERSLGAFLGLVPSESSSGARRRLGSITKTGNGHARRLLVEAAWQHRRPLRASRELTLRRASAPRPCAPSPSWPIGVCSAAGRPSMRAANVPRSARWP